MNILAIDTAGKTAAVAVMRDDTLLYEMASNTGLTHSETLLPMVDTLLRPTPPAPGFPPWLPWLTACAGKAL